LIKKVKYKLIDVSAAHTQIHLFLVTEAIKKEKRAHTNISYGEREKIRGEEEDE
jgi:hypothetical protein